MSKETESKINEYQEALEIVDEAACESLSRKYLKKHYILLKELVDKATPKKPIKRVLKRFEGDRCIVDVCPICDSELYYGQSCSNNKCRQAIDWSK